MKGACQKRLVMCMFFKKLFNSMDWYIQDDLELNCSFVYFDKTDHGKFDHFAQVLF